MIDVQAERVMNLPAGTHHFRLSKGFRYALLVSAENGGASSILLKSKWSDSSGVEPDFFEPGEAFGAHFPVPIGSILEIVLAGEEAVHLVRHTYIS